MKWRKIKYILFHRSVLAGLALVAQVAVLFVMVNEFTAHFDYFYWFCIFVSFLATVWIVSDRSEPCYKIAWLVVILPFPVFGGILYLLLGGNRISERTRRKMKGIAERSNEVLRGDFKADRLTHLDEDAVGQIRYLERYASCPAYTNTRTEYFPVGDLAFVRMPEELEKAGIAYQVMDVNEHRELVARYGIQQAPTLIVRHGEQVEKLVNASTIKKYAVTHG